MLKIDSKDHKKFTRKYGKREESPRSGVACLKSIKALQAFVQRAHPISMNLLRVEVAFRTSHRFFSTSSDFLLKFKTLRDMG